MTGCGAKRARQEVEASISRLFTYGDCGQDDARCTCVPIRGVAIA